MCISVRHLLDSLMPFICDKGAATLRQIAAHLNAEGIQTARGGAWSAAQVQRVMQAA
jgi:Recombinase-like helix-turn-helix domain